MAVRQHDLEAAVGIVETNLAQRRQEAATEMGTLEARLATTRNRLEGDMATAVREHNARIKAMKHNEAKVAAELAAKAE